VEYITGMDTRVGFPNEHLAGDSDDEVTSPLFATAVGLVMDGLRRQEKKCLEKVDDDIHMLGECDDEDEEQVSSQIKKERKSFLDKLTERVKDFLDNAE